MSTTKYPFPVYGTQGGGLAKRVGEILVFVEAPPPGMGLNVGDKVPSEWDYQPANEAARDQVREDLNDCY